jgi:UDPglucose 6-dehydrogenase
MHICMIGTGYVGLVSGTCFAEMGNTVTCVDIDQTKINRLKSGNIPIYEPHLESLVVRNYQEKRLHFSTSLKDALVNATLVFIAVGTPMGEDGSADLRSVLAVAHDIGMHMNHSLIVVDKSTVPVGTADNVRNTIQKALNSRQISIPFDVVSNPEFLKEGDAVNDFLKPDRVVIGADNKTSMETLKELYAPFTRNRERFIGMSIRSAEMTKYAANAMLATKISFMNELSQICEKVNANINDVRVGIGSDSRIGYSFIYPGCGYGGSCFPKDVRALEKIANDTGIETKIMRAVQEVNEAQKHHIAHKVIKRFGDDLSKKTFVLWGLSFKPETDDMREASSITIIHDLIDKGACIHAYDPKALHEAKTHYLSGLNIQYFENKYDALNGCDAMILVTEWKEFRSPDFYEIKNRLNQPVIFDGRNQYNKERLESDGFEYFQIGVATNTDHTVFDNQTDKKSPRSNINQ